MVANLHPPKRGPLCPCHFWISTCGDLRAIRVIDEWHVDLGKNVTMEKLGNYPACPDSRIVPDLRAIRVADRRATNFHTPEDDGPTQTDSHRDPQPRRRLHVC